MENPPKDWIYVWMVDQLEMEYIIGVALSNEWDRVKSKSHPKFDMPRLIH